MRKLMKKRLARRRTAERMVKYHSFGNSNIEAIGAENTIRYFESEFKKSLKRMKTF